MTLSEAREAEKDLDVLAGKGPGGMMNFGYNDNYFAASLRNKYGMGLAALEKEVKKALDDHGVGR